MPLRGRRLIVALHGANAKEEHAITLGAATRAFDRFQQRHRALAFPLAVWQKYTDDQGAFLAATISYYGFFSLFPLLLVGTTILGFVLDGNPSLEQRVVDTTLAQFPVIGPQLKVGALTGSPLVLATGLLVALWSGTSVFLAAENAMNQIWGIPFRKRSDPFKARAKALLLVVVVGTGALVATALSFLGTFGSSYGAEWKALSIVLSLGLDFVLFWCAFRILTVAHVEWADTWIGAALAAGLYQLLQTLGSLYVERVVRHASELYGTFALVIGLLSWIYLATTIVLYAAEANVVVIRRLWPRSFSALIEQPATLADAEALTQRALVEERRRDESIDVRWR